MKPEPRNPLLISFSGLDGSGKTTQIENVRRILSELRLESRLLTFWDDVVVGSRFRESFVHKVYNSERGIGAPGKPVRRRDKNVRKWYLNLARHLLYLLDALHLCWVIARERRLLQAASSSAIIVVDRYIYDELANLPLGNPLTRAYIRMVRALTPQPDIAYLLDADPEAAHARKPEYDVEFMHSCRKAYSRLAELLGNLTLIPPLPLPQALRAVEVVLKGKLGVEVAVTPAAEQLAAD